MLLQQNAFQFACVIKCTIKCTIQSSKGVNCAINQAFNNRLSGKVCIITGNGGSTGRAAALLFPSEGARVIGRDVNVENAAETNVS
jgi:S-adenosylhomocysteine hydrolase